MANEDVAWGYELENYINIGTPEAPKWVKIARLMNAAKEKKTPLQESLDKFSSKLDRKSTRLNSSHRT